MTCRERGRGLRTIPSVAAPREDRRADAVKSRFRCHGASNQCTTQAGPGRCRIIAHPERPADLNARSPRGMRRSPCKVCTPKAPIASSIMSCAYSVRSCAFQPATSVREIRKCSRFWQDPQLARPRPLLPSRSSCSGAAVAEAGRRPRHLRAEALAVAAARRAPTSLSRTTPSHPRRRRCRWEAPSHGRGTAAQATATAGRCAATTASSSMMERAAIQRCRVAAASRRSSRPRAPTTTTVRSMVPQCTERSSCSSGSEPS